MTLKELILSNINWKNVQEVWLKLYPDDITRMNQYEKMFYNLRKMSTKTYKTVKFVIYIKENPDVYYGYEVYAKKIVKGKTVRSKYREETYALEFKKWREWLGMTISDETINTFDSATIICLCMREMTMAGENEKIINEKKLNLRNRLKSGLESIKNGTAKYISSKEFLAQIKKKLQNK